MVEGHSAAWRLQANDAVVLIGDSPPEMRYWGLTNYLFNRHYENADGKNTTVTSISQCPKPPARCESFASLGDTQNMINAQLTETSTSKTSERCDGEGKDKVCHNITAFDSTWAYVMSPSESVTKLVEADLISKGIVDHVRHYPYPGDMLNLSDKKWGDNDDILSILLRMAFPTRPEEMQSYIDNSRTNNKVFRVTVPDEEVGDFSVYSKPTLIERKMNRKESVVDENAKEIVSN